MSKRYSSERQCPDCGLTIAYSTTRGFRAHIRQAAEAGRIDAACAAGSKLAELHEAKIHEQASRAMRVDYWQAKEAEQTALPKHLR